MSTGNNTEYAGNYVYENGGLQFFNTPEGYVTFEANEWQYIYQYRDHMGSVRLSYMENPQNGNLEIIQENNFYPFGLQHEGYNDIVSAFGNSTGQGWKYQGQEFTEDLELGFYEFTYRMHDPAIGRFWQVDPLAEEYSYNSTYAFQENKLGMGVEFEGLEVSQHRWLDDDGKNRIEYNAHIKVFNNSSASIEDVINYANAIASEIEKTFSGTDSDGNVVNTSVSLEFVASVDEENDFVMEFTDQIVDSVTGEEHSADGMVDRIGDSEVNKMQLLIPGQTGAPYGEAVTYDGLLKNGAHEFGHTVGLNHQVGSTNFDSTGIPMGINNLMRASNRADRQQGGINPTQLSVLQNTVQSPAVIELKRQMRNSIKNLNINLNNIFNKSKN